MTCSVFFSLSLSQLRVPGDMLHCNAAIKVVSDRFGFLTRVLNNRFDKAEIKRLTL